MSNIYSIRPEPAGATSLSENFAKTLASLPVLDSSVFNDLRESLQGRRELLQRICTTFVSSAENLVGLIGASLEIDSRELAKHLHTLSGSAGMIGAHQVRYLAGKLRSAVESSPREEIPGIETLLMQAIGRFKREFEARLESMAPGDGLNTSS